MDEDSFLTRVDQPPTRIQSSIANNLPECIQHEDAEHEAQSEFTVSKNSHTRLPLMLPDGLQDLCPYLTH